MNPAEWTFARLMYPTCHSYQMRGCWRGEGDEWKLGMSNWTIDFPAADRHVAEMVRRLTVIDARSVEQSVNLDDGDDVFYWPWLYAVEVGHWELTDSQVVKLREYLLRGGFLMVDDFHGTQEWEVFRREHAARVPGSADRGHPGRRPDLPHRSGTSTIAYRCRACSSCTAAEPTRRTATRRVGAASTTTRAASWSPSATTWTWATPWSTPITPALPREVLGAGHAHVHQLHLLRDDALSALIGAPLPRP